MHHINIKNTHIYKIHTKPLANKKCVDSYATKMEIKLGKRYTFILSAFSLLLSEAHIENVKVTK